MSIKNLFGVSADFPDEIIHLLLKLHLFIGNGNNTDMLCSSGIWSVSLFCSVCFLFNLWTELSQSKPSVHGIWSSLVFDSSLHYILLLFILVYLRNSLHSPPTCISNHSYKLYENWQKLIISHPHKKLKSDNVADVFFLIVKALSEIKITSKGALGWQVVLKGSVWKLQV